MCHKIILFFWWLISLNHLSVQKQFLINRPYKNQWARFCFPNAGVDQSELEEKIQESSERKPPCL
jgi:hypothetical protein